jgi:hypothetical protein
MTSDITKLRGLGHVLTHSSIQLAVWEHWCAELEQHFDDPLEFTLKVSNPERKWELVSAYQKSVRRGHLELALKLVSAMVSMTGERTYMWRRVATTSAEDIGAGDPMVMKFVLACHSIYTPSKLTDRMALNLWGLLTKLMCAAQKSRVYCQLDVLRQALEADPVPQIVNGDPESQVVADVLALDLKVLDVDPASHWLIKNNGRAEGLAVGALWVEILSLTLSSMPQATDEPRLIKGLPDYAYDMHTRTGKIALARLCNHEEVLKWFTAHPTKNKIQAVGHAVFYQEGGVISNGWTSPKIDRMTERMEGLQAGWDEAQWVEFSELISGLIAEGVLLGLRSKVADSFYD